jgi:hypothetical protein
MDQGEMITNGSPASIISENIWYMSFFLEIVTNELVVRICLAQTFKKGGHCAHTNCDHLDRKLL